MKQFPKEGEYDSGWLHALGYIRNWIHVKHPKPNKAIQDIIDEIKEMESGQWENQP